MKASEFLFKKYSPKNKLAFINDMSNVELASVTEKDILRIIKEAGRRIVPNHVRKELYFSRNRRPNNNWNSSVTSIFEGKDHKVYISVYIQGDDTDRDCEISFSEAFKTDIWGYFEEEYRDGYAQRIIARYSYDRRMEFIRAVLKEYVYAKYKDKLDGESTD